LSLPNLINQLYGKFEFTGLYSFEFVDRNRNTISEIFFMVPPKKKDMSEPTRSSTQATLSGNYVMDAGNGTKPMTISGELFFPYVGSPDNPVARDSSGLSNTIDGLNEFFKLRWMLIRYRDYTMTKNARMTVPTSVMGLSPGINALYRKISKNLKNKVGALYDEVKVVVHDYDMDDHWYCRVESFSSSMDSAKHIATEYIINLECYSPDTRRSSVKVTQTKKPTNEQIDITNSALQQLNFTESFSNIQAEIGYNANFVSASVDIDDIIADIATENESIQAGQSTALYLLPTLISKLLKTLENARNSFIATFLSSEQQTQYDAGTITLDEILNIDLISFYNTLQYIKLYAESIHGILNSVVRQEEIRYYANADDYTLTTDQFDSGNENMVEGSTTFYYYTVMAGDTSRLIAARELKDGEKFISILKINDIDENDFIDGTLVGQQIKIPLDISTASRGEDNLVYESDPSDISKFLYGTDLASDIENKLMLSATGDLLGLSGIENVYSSIERRVQNTRGSLNVFNPNWGVIPIDDGAAPLMVKIDRYISDLVDQIQSDPRVESVKMDLSKLEFVGEKIVTHSSIYFIGTEEHREITI